MQYSAQQLESVKPQPWHPKRHHKQGLKFLLQNACAGLLADPGMGKTSITLAAVKVLRQQHLIDHVLVVAPLRPCWLVWPKERAKWTDFNSLKMEVLHGPRKAQAAQRTAHVYVVNPDGLQWLIDSGTLAKLLRKRTMLVVDESTKFKYTKTKRFKLLKPWLTQFKRRVVLTGTPVPKGYLDLFGQMYMLDLGSALGQYITHYRMQYFIPTGYGGYTWVLKPGGERQIQKQIRPYTLRLQASAKDMPERIENVLRIQLPTGARKIYDQMEEELLALLSSGQEVRAKNAAVASGKCRQVANGGLYYRNLQMDPNGFVTDVGSRQWENLHTEKVDAVGDLVEQLQGSPLIVAYDFQHDLDRLLKAFPKAAVLGGGTSIKHSIALEAAWNKGEIEMMLAHPAAMGHGLNLQSGPGHTVAWHSLTWDYELYDQFIRRVWRSGQASKHVTVHHIMARDTVDEVILRALRAKQKSQDALLQALRLYALKRRTTL